MAPTNPNQGSGYQFSEEKPVEQEPQKMSGPRGVDTPVDVKAEKVAAPAERKERSGIVDKGGARGAHPAFRQGNQVKEKKVEETQPREEEETQEETGETPAVTKRGGAESFMGVESVDQTTPPWDHTPTPIKKKVDPVETARRVKAQVETADRSFEPGSLPASMKFAVKVARRWQGVPETMSDMEAINAGFLTPEMLQLILTIALSMFQDCLPNQPAMAWSRIKNYNGAKPMDRVSDDIRLAWLVDRWFSRMAFPRDKGDVRLVAKALADEAAASNEETFRKVQTDMLFMTV